MREFVLRRPSDVTRFLAWLMGLIRETALADALHVQVAPYSAPRSLEQNARYWALLGEIAEQAVVNGRRFSKEAWHVELKGRFLGWEETPSGHRFPISTTRLSRRRMSELMEEITAFAARELGVRFDDTERMT
jgi:hypothetical protein